MSVSIPYSLPSITDLEQQYAADAAQFGWGARCYEYIDRFEELFARYSGAEHAIATSSCTGAIHMGLVSAGVGKGDEVILGDTNWVASAAPITYVGAKPVFVDIDESSFCLDPRRVEAAITARTKAIMAVHLYGNLCDMDALQDISERYGIPIIEDAAEAIGSSFKGSIAGSIGLFGTFSFHGTKTVTCGEGGMLITNDSRIASSVRTLNNHGRASGAHRAFWPETIGYKYKMSNIQAAIGCAQMERIDDLVSRKREILAYYKAALIEYPQIKLNPEPEHTVNGAWMPTVVFDKELPLNLEKIIDAFHQQKIDARVVFWPLSTTGLFTDTKAENKIAAITQKRAINLPSYHDMTNSEQDRVVDVIRTLLAS